MIPVSLALLQHTVSTLLAQVRSKIQYVTFIAVGILSAANGLNDSREALLATSKALGRQDGALAGVADAKSQALLSAADAKSQALLNPKGLKAGVVGGLGAAAALTATGFDAQSVGDSVKFLRKFDYDFDDDEEFEDSELEFE